YNLPVAIRWSLLRRKEEGKLKAFEKYLIDEKKNIFLDALWFGTQSLAFIEVYSHCYGGSGRCFWNFLDFVGPCTVEVSFAARWFLGSIKFRLWHFPETLQVRPYQSWAPP